MKQFDIRPEDLSGWPLVDGAAFPACLLDRQLRYRQANAGWAAYAYGDAADAPDQPVSLTERDFLLDVPPERRARWTTALRMLLAGRLGHFLDEATEPSPTGQHVAVTTASPWIGPGGAVDGILCIRYDLTDAVRGAANEAALNDVLVAARRLQHFLGNQLALTLGYVELLTLDTRLPIDLRERVDEALRGVVEATATLSKLRSLTRFELAPDDPSIVAPYPGHTDRDG